MPIIAYYSSATENTHTFVNRLRIPTFRIQNNKLKLPLIKESYVLVIPTYADGKGQGAVPKPVVHFLNRIENRILIQGVIAGGNRNFGSTYALSGDVISKKCNVPCLYRFELRGTNFDVYRVCCILKNFW